MIRRLIVSAVLVVTASIATPVVATESAAPLSGVNGFHALVRLEPGTSGTDVADLQQALADAGFYHFEIDGVFGKTTISAVIAFHKYLRAERTTTFNALDWIRLALLPNPGIPYRWNESDYIEVDVGRQLLFLVRDGEVVQVLPVSTGGGYTYWSIRQAAYVTARTPHADFDLRSHQRGWSCDSVTGWCVYKYWAFTSSYGIHGYRHVPPYPASHGCIRVELWDADWLEPYLALGMPLHVWDQPPVIPPPPRPLGPRPPLAVPPD
jgi:hypothetical protein